MVKPLAWVVSRSTSKVALAERGVSLTRRGRWGDGETSGKITNCYLLPKLLLTTFYSLLTFHYPQCPMPNAQCPKLLVYSKPHLQLRAVNIHLCGDVKRTRLLIPVVMGEIRCQSKHDYTASFGGDRQK